MPNTHELAPEILALWEDPDFAANWDMGSVSRPPDICGKNDSHAVELMVQWFFTNFEDPAEGTPHHEGEFVFIWGDPFDAREELEAAFGNTATEQALEDAVTRIEEDCYEWAPSSNRMCQEEETDPVIRAKQRLMHAMEDWDTAHSNNTGFNEAEAVFRVSDVALLLREHHRLRRLVTELAK